MTARTHRNRWAAAPAWLLFFVMSVTSGSAAAQEAGFWYWSDGPVLARERAGETLWVQSADEKNWRAVLDLTDEAFARHRVVGLQCAPVRPVCLVGLARPGTDRQMWVRVATNVSAPASIALEADVGLTVHDVAETDDILALVSRWSRTPGPFEGGLYLWRLDQPASEARLISNGVFRAQPGSAVFVSAPGQAPTILNRQPGPPITWTAYGLSGRMVRSQAAAGWSFTIDGRTLLTPVTTTSAREPDLPAGSLLVAPIPLEEDEAWPWRKAFTADEFAILDQNGESPSWSALTMGVEGALVGVFQGREGIDVREFCQTGGYIQTRSLEGERPILAHAMMVSASGAAHMLAALTDLWGYTAQYAVVAPADFRRGASVRACDGTALRLERLSAASPTDSPLTLESFTVAADDGAEIPYVVLGLFEADGPVMIRPYGAFGVVVRTHAIDVLEQRWLQRGNRLVVPTLRGDGGSRDWIFAGRGDYKARATADLLAVVQDLHRRGMDDPDRPVLVGHSAGAVVSARAALSNPDLFSSVILISGGMDLSLLETVGEDEFGPKIAGFDWMEAGPVPTADAPRFLLWHAQDDDRVPVESSTRFASFLKSLGYRGALTISDRGGHAPTLRNDTADAILEFIDHSPSETPLEVAR